MAINLATNPYGITQDQNMYENQAHVAPPSYVSYLDANGQLKSPYQIDPTKSQAFSHMSSIAQDPGLSPWAKLQSQQNDLSTAHQRDQSNAQTMGANSQAMSQLMTTGGGANSGAAAFLASQGARNNVMANQNIGAQSQQNALGIQQTDAQNKQNLLGQVANTETGAQAANAQSAMQDTTNANLYNVNRYQQQMQAWAAAQTADGQQAAASQSGGKK